MKKPATEYHMLPIANYPGKNCFCVTYDADDMAGLKRGDLLYVDPDRCEPAPGTFVVRINARPLSVYKVGPDKSLQLEGEFYPRDSGDGKACVLAARKTATGWVFTNTNRRFKRKVYTPAAVTVIGLVICMTRQV